MSRYRHLVSTLLTTTLVAAGLAMVTAPAQAVETHGPYPAKVAIDGRGSMDPDDRIKTDAYLAGDDVHVVCQDTGLSAGGSTLWIYTDDGYWIPDAYVTTGTDGFLSGVPRCLALGIVGTPASGGASDGPYPVKFAVDGRGSADPDDRVRVDAYPEGSSLYVRCQDYGVSVNGSTLWIYTIDGYWVPDAYVTTGTDGRLSGVPLCSSIGIDGGTGAVPGGGTQFKVRTTLNGYFEKSLSAGNVWDKYPEGSYLTLMCQAYGEVNYGGSAIWGLTSDGLWVPDFYVITGTNGFVMDRCDSDGPSGGGNRFLAKATLNGYHDKSLNATYVLDKYPAGTYVTIECQAYGEFNYGGYAVWGHTSDSLWVADYYLSTGSWDIILPRCDNDPKPSGGPGNPTVPPTPNPGTVATSDIRSAIVNAARTQLGTHEWGDNCNPYGYHGAIRCGAPWCSMFASWTWQQAGIDVYFPYTGDFGTWGKKRGLTRSKDEIRPGDVVIYGTSYWDSDHIGVVVEVLPNGDITTIEGNYGNQVRKVGPFDPHNPDAGVTGHSYSNIYAVVAPTPDPVTSADWTTWTNSDEDSENDGVDFGEELCSEVHETTGVYYRACLVFSGGISRAKPRLYVSPKDYSAAVRGKLTMIDADGDLHVLICETAILRAGRTCEGRAFVSTIEAVTRLRADIETNGTWRDTLWVGAMDVDGHQQEEDTWCGVGTTQAVLESLGTSPLPSQDSLAERLGTGETGTRPWDSRDVLNAELDGRGGLRDYVYHDYAAEGRDSDKWTFVKNKIRRSVELGQPATVVVAVEDIPWWKGDPPWWDPNSWPIGMHFLVVAGYSGVQVDGEFVVDKFMMWDPANDNVFFASSSEMYSMTNSDGLPGQGHMIVVAE